ncbi:contact-dependent growth inhibition system immunity protein [Trinickia sp. YCB016]
MTLVFSYYVLTAFLGSNLRSISESKYLNLWNIIVGHFHEDFDLFGQNIEEIISYHKSVSDASARAETIREIDEFKTDNQGNLDAALEREFGRQFDPKLWGHTTESFLDELKHLLKA